MGAGNTDRPEAPTYLREVAKRDEVNPAPPEGSESTMLREAWTVASVKAVKSGTHCQQADVFLDVDRLQGYRVLLRRSLR